MPSMELVLAVAAAAGIGAASASFLASARAKLRAPLAFRTAVRGYGVVPERSLTTVAVAVPYLEALAAVGLVAALLGGDVRLAAPAIALAVVFALAVAAAIRAGRSAIDCGCRPGRRRPLGPDLVAGNLLLALALPLAVGLVGALPAALRAFCACAGAAGFLLLDSVLGILAARARAGVATAGTSAK
ncbi:MauE/DoxX family redox-associated membrane protein [Thermaurantiacus tibetensis]|uniref:MauE/DoxX family redox-associated membrane protein n=1 Tax=Thermaurantiacus tibetensis TaxID=2759035 RepID=UPI0018900DAB|nr:MauE/DoxX family redox-associated membrane protein [Thermaurantiacus tibetensis]